MKRKFALGLIPLIISCSNTPAVNDEPRVLDVQEKPANQPTLEEHVDADTEPDAGGGLNVTEELLIAWSQDSSRLELGREIFVKNCAPCHGDHAQGLIGPNHTDNFWIHGPRAMDHFRVITDGVPEKGMVSWGNILSTEQRAAVTAYLLSVAGTNPPNPKAPQGDEHAP